MRYFGPRSCSVVRTSDSNRYTLPNFDCWMTIWVRRSKVGSLGRLQEHLTRDGHAEVTQTGGLADDEGGGLTAAISCSEKSPCSAHGALWQIGMLKVHLKIEFQC